MALTITYDPFDPAYHEDPHPTLAVLREHDPVHRSPIGTFVLTRYEDVWSLVRDRRLGRDFGPELMRVGFGDGEASLRFAENMLNKEGADHTRLRKLMTLPFTPARVRELRAHTEELVRKMLDELGDRFDVAADIGGVLPVLVICDLLGLPAEDRERVRPWAAAIAEATVLPVPPAVQARLDRAMTEFIAYFEELIADRSYSPDGLFAALLAAEADGERLSHEELIVNAVLLFFAGFETTTNLIGNGTSALLRHPDEFERLRHDAALAPTAVEEMLRYDSPVLFAPRITHEPIETSTGATIKAHRVLELSLAAANRDPRQFPGADRFDIGRADNHHVAFGSGAHFCLGAHLARLEAECVFAEMATRYVGMEADGDPVRKASPGIRGFDSLPVRASFS